MVFPKQQSNDHYAIIHGEQKVSYKELLRQIISYKNILIHKNIKKMAICSENRIEWIVALYAGLKNKTIVVPIDFMSSTEEVKYILEDFEPEFIFCSKSKKELITQSSKNLDKKIEIFCFDEDRCNTEMTHFDPFSFSMDNSEETALIVYTSGTTGSPKGVMISYRALNSNIKVVTEEIKIYQQYDRIFAFLPFHHSFPLVGSIMIPLALDGIIVMPLSFSSKVMLKTIQDNKVHLLIGVPRFYQLIATEIKSKIDNGLISKSIYFISKRLSRRKISKFLFKTVHKKFGGNIRHIICGGAPLDQKISETFYTLGFDLLEGYGMTEAAPLITFTRPGEGIPGSVGKTFLSIEVKVIDNEIWAKGPNIMNGYYKKEKETNEALVDGWLKTGDLGYFDSKGRLFITGRKKDVIILSNAKNIGPYEIEFKIRSLSPLINEVGVCPHNDKIKALVYPNYKEIKERNISNISAILQSEVFDKYNESVASYKRIAAFKLTKEELPKTRLGKIKRFTLSQFFALM